MDTQNDAAKRRIGDRFRTITPACLPGGIRSCCAKLRQKTKLGIRMERELAERLLAAIDSLNPGLDQATAIMLEMNDKDEAKLLRRHLGHIMSGPLFDLVMHVVSQYPDLDPD